MFINGIEEMGSSIQQYCLRWNNHRSNLLLVFEHLFQTEAFTDVTLACDGSSIKCHKMVLAACSSYFQHLFMENDCRHPIVILKDIRFSEIKAILEYMYKGEVNVAQDQLAGLLKAAETLKVKGLVEDNQSASGTPTPPHQPVYPQPPSHSTPEFHSGRESAGSRSADGASSSYSKTNSIPSKYVSTSDTLYEGPYNASNMADRNSMPFNLWNSSKFVSPSPKGSNGSGGNVGSTGGNGPNNGNAASGNGPTGPPFDSVQSEPLLLKKKKYMHANKDTPILRTVLGHTSLQANAVESHPKTINYSMSGSSVSNGPTEHNENIHIESPDHYMDESIRSVDSDHLSEDNLVQFKMDCDKSGLATYVPHQQKPEWKRYKQYTRNDIMAAIEAVKQGMSALQAARKFGVPSRTLYDKVKKLGITTNRPYRKGSYPSPYHGRPDMDTAGFPYDDKSLNASGAGNGIGLMEHESHETDSDKMDSNQGSSIKQEHSPPGIGDDRLGNDSDEVASSHMNEMGPNHMGDMTSGHMSEDHAGENGSEPSSSTSPRSDQLAPREREPSESEEHRAGSD